jgi:hypothetical protein
MGKIRLEPGQSIRISDTTIEVDVPVVGRSRSRMGLHDTTLVDTHETRLDIAEMIDAAAPVFEPGQPIDPDRAQALALLYELPLQFGEQTELDALFQTIIERLVAIIPAATRGALLLEDQASGELLLRAHLPAGQPSVSRPLRQDMARRQGFIWHEGWIPSQSQFLNRIKAGMYVPLIWKGRMGVACVDNSDGGRSSPLTICALCSPSRTRGNGGHAEPAARRASPQRHASAGSPTSAENPRRCCRSHSAACALAAKVGSRYSGISYRGFTKLTTDDVMDLLNDYFSVLVDAIFKHDGRWTRSQEMPS